MNRAAGAEIVVGVGDCRIAEFPAASLVTYALGSCLAIVVFDWRARLGGLLHVMLPDSEINRLKSESNPFLYVDTGVAELFRRLNDLGSPKTRVRCCIAGGASMMADSSHFEIGKRNYLALRKAFGRLGIFVDREDVGGVESRSVRLDLATGQIDLRKGSDRGIVLAPAAIHLMGRDGNGAGVAPR